MFFSEANLNLIFGIPRIDSDTSPQQLLLDIKFFAMLVKNAIGYVLLCLVLFTGQLGAQSSGVWRSSFGIRPEKVTPAFPVFGTEVFGVPQGSGFNRYAYS